MVVRSFADRSGLAWLSQQSQSQSQYTYQHTSITKNPLKFTNFKRKQNQCYMRQKLPHTPHKATIPHATAESRRLRPSPHVGFLARTPLDLHIFFPLFSSSSPSTPKDTLPPWPAQSKLIAEKSSASVATMRTSFSCQLPLI